MFIKVIIEIFVLQLSHGFLKIREILLEFEHVLAQTITKLMDMKN